MTYRYFEDFAVGDTFPLPARQIGEPELLTFAQEFDALPFVQGAEAPAADQANGGIASGWLVCAVFMRMFYDGVLVESSCLGAPGVDTLKWRRPVRPGDILSGRTTVLEARSSRSRPDVGILRLRQEMFDQGGERVMWMEHPLLFRRRSASRGEEGPPGLARGEPEDRLRPDRDLELP
jgi:acyl dehydratase